MSDTEGDAPAPAPVAVVTDVGSMDIYQALQEVLKTALIHGGLCRGVKEATKTLDNPSILHKTSFHNGTYVALLKAHLCVLANSVDEPLYVKLIEALCAEHSINLLKVDDAKKLGEWAGLCKLDKEGKARKVNACGVVVVKDYGMETPALDIVKDYFKSK